MPALSGHLPSMRDYEVRRDGSVWQNGLPRPQFTVNGKAWKNA